VGRPHSEASALFAQRVAARLQLSSEQRNSHGICADCERPEEPRRPHAAYSR
jgi:hypothetical protein